MKREDLAVRLKTIRESKGLTKYRLAKLSRISQTYIYRKTRFKTDAFWLTEEKTPIKGKGIQEMLARRSKAAGLPRIHPHMFRHSCAVNLLLNGMDIDSVMKYLGQETVTVLQGYLKSLKSENASELHKRFSPARRYFER